MKQRILLEPLLTSPHGFGLVTATPVQRAICRASDGIDLGDLWDVPEVQLAFGGTKPEPGVIPDLIAILAGIRGAKSMFCAAKAIQASQNCDLTHVSAGDELRIPVLATDKDMAHVVYSHIVGNMLASPMLKKLIIGEPTADSLTVRHPSGKPIEIKVTALARYASTLIGRWLPGCIFDEAPRMVGSDDGVRNLSDSLTAIAGRMLGPIMLIGSPWAPFGPVYSIVQEHFGKPSKDVMVVRGKGPWMNPSYWTPTRCEEVRRKNPKSYQTDVEAEFADPEEAIFPSTLVEQNARASVENVPPRKHHEYTATMDPATRANAWTLVLTTCTGLSTVNALQKKYSVDFAKQWVGSKLQPLKPRQVLLEISEVCKAYGVETIVTDQHSFDALADIAEEFGLSLINENMKSEDRLESYGHLQLLLESGALELPNNKFLKADLIGVRKRITQNGYTIVLPKTGDGRHSDFAPPLSLLVKHLPELPREPVKVIEDEWEQAFRSGATESKGDFWSNLVSRVTQGS